MTVAFLHFAGWTRWSRARPTPRRRVSTSWSASSKKRSTRAASASSLPMSTPTAGRSSSPQAPVGSGENEGQMLLALREIVDAAAVLRSRSVSTGDRVRRRHRNHLPPQVHGDGRRGEPRSQVMAHAQPGQILATTSVLDSSPTLFEINAVEPFFVKGKRRPVTAFSVGPARACRGGGGRGAPARGSRRRSRRVVPVVDGLTSGRGGVIEIVGDPGAASPGSSARSSAGPRESRCAPPSAACTKRPLRTSRSASCWKGSSACRAVPTRRSPASSRLCPWPRRTCGRGSRSSASRSVSSGRPAQVRRGHGHNLLEAGDRLVGTARHADEPSGRWPIGKYGVAAWYKRHWAVRAGIPAARRSISLKNRDLPTPGSPTISITPPRPDVSPSTTGTRARYSSRPTSGSSAPATSTRTPRAGPTENAVTGRRLPLTKNGSSASVSNRVRELSSTDTVARSCPGCARAIATGEVHRVAHHRVVAAEGGSDVAREHVPRVDTDLERQRRLPLDDLPQRKQHLLLVLTRSDWRACGEDDLPAVGVDIGSEEATPRGSIASWTMRTNSSRLAAAASGEHTTGRVQPGEVQEHDRHPAVLRSPLGAAQHLPEGGGHEWSRIAVDGAEHNGAGPKLATARRSAEARTGGRSHVRGRDRHGRLRPDDDLTGAGHAFDRDRGARGRAHDDQLTVRPPTRKKSNGPLWRPTVMRSVTVPARSRRVAIWRSVLRIS